MISVRGLVFSLGLGFLLGLVLIGSVPLAAGEAETALEAEAGVVAIPETAPEVSTELEVVGESETTPFDIFRDIGKIINDWRNIGWIAGLIALINMLINLLRFKPINEFLEERDLKWLKPLAACVLGGSLGGLTTYQTGAPWLNSVAAGVLTALGSVGFHELISTLLERTTRKYKAPTPV
jgi:hypothetical protein